MPRAKKTKPNRSDGRYEVKITIGKDLNGKSIRKSFFSTINLEDARNKAKQWEIDQKVAKKTGIGIISENIRFYDFCLQYLNVYKKGQVADTTFKAMVKRLDKYIKPYMGFADISSIRPIDIQNFFQSPGVSIMSSALKNKLKFFLSDVFEKAIDNDLCYKNPVRNIKLPEYQKVTKKMTYSEEQVRLIIDYIKSHDISKDIAIILKTGLRRGELLALEWSDISLENKSIVVNKAIKDGSGSPIIGVPKSKAGYRTILFDEELLEILTKIPKKENTDLLISNLNGKPVSPTNWYHRKYKPALEKIVSYYAEQGIDIPILSPHELRHSYGTILYNRGVDLRTIQKVMGHSDLNTTSQIYVHDNLEVMRKNMNFDDTFDDKKRSNNQKKLEEQEI